MKTRMIPTAVMLAALVGATLSTASFAQDGGHGPEMNFEAMDADKDGKLTEAEMEAYRVARLTALDADKDGKVTLAELTALGKERTEKRAERRAARMLERHDADGDGVLTVAELTTRPERKSMFSRIDADGDGSISKAEAEAAHERFAQRREGHGKRKHSN